MIPDKKTAFEPDDSTVGDRLFSQLPLDDRWRLIKEAFRASRDSDALPYIPFSWRSPVTFWSTIVSFTVGGSLLVFAIPLKYVSASFKLWFFLQLSVILVLHFLAKRFDRKVRRQGTYMIAKSLSELEAITLRESGGSGGAA